MTTTTSARDEAELHLRALVGRDDARLHDDQWAAIEALVVHQSRVLVVQRTGWGKSAVYFVATALMRSAAAATSTPRASAAARANAPPTGPVRPGTVTSRRVRVPSCSTHDSISSTTVRSAWLPSETNRETPRPRSR